MTLDQLRFLIETEKPFEFTFNGVKYNLTYDKDSSHKKYIVFGRLYEGKRYNSFGEFINHAKVDNYFFRELLADL
ncbi:MAG: hypothetical protein K5930_07510 [Treponemataceae bacterium]|nr:hypothetical protein [Treponemataceae bacterium]